eukprot:symbB.v1.2.028586.t1/scaffold3042.1/size64827/4
MFFDFVWLDGLLDFAPPKKGEVAGSIDAFLSLLWPHLLPGALVLLHSTLTNSAVRGWLENVGERSPWGPPGAMLSLLEPHKKFQNSVTILQHRPEGRMMAKNLRGSEPKQRHKETNHMESRRIVCGMGGKEGFDAFRVQVFFKLVNIFFG